MLLAAFCSPQWPGFGCSARSRALSLAASPYNLNRGASSPPFYFPMKLSKKIITVVTLLCFLTGPAVRPAHAWIPLLFTGIFNAASLASWIKASAWVHVAAAGAYAWYHSRGTDKKKVDVNGNIYRDGQLTWIDLKGGKPVGKTGEVIGKVPYDMLKAIVESNPTRYPNLAQAISGQPPNVNKDTKVGDVVNVPGYGKMKVHNITYSIPACQHTANIGTTVYGGLKTSILISGGTASCSGNYSSGMWMYIWYDATNDIVPKSPHEAAKTLANVAEMLAAQNIYSDRYGNEIDDFLKDNPNVIEFVDGNIESPESSQPFVPPTMPSRDSVDNAGGGGASPGGGSGGSGGGVGSPGYPPSPFPADDDGDGVPDDDDGDGNPDPGDTEEDEDGAFQPPKDNSYDGDIEQPDKKDISGLLSDWLASSPLLALVRGISVEGSNAESQYSINIYGRQIVLDFSQWSGVLSGCGSAFLAVSHIAAVFLIFRRDE